MITFEELLEIPAIKNLESVSINTPNNNYLVEQTSAWIPVPFHHYWLPRIQKSN